MMSSTQPSNTPTVSEEEYRRRVSRAQVLLAARGLSALILTTEADIRYFTGFLTRFWESPSRPWFLVLPAVGRPIAVIPEIGAALMGRSWITDIRTWPSPDPVDDGLTLLADTLREVAGFRGRIGVPSGAESYLRMPLSGFESLKTLIAPLEISRAEGIVRDLRAIKSAAEIEMIRASCAIATRAFDRVGEIAQPGVPLAEVFRQFQILCLQEGADHVGYLAGGAGPGGYADVISPASDRPLQAGDVLMLDTGCVKEGYYCDFNRNFAIGAASDAQQSAHARLIEAVQAGMSVLRPGVSTREVFDAMADVCKLGPDAGRLGHGLGMQLTEGLSFSARDDGSVEAGMVVTLEPYVELPGGGIMVHEENFVVRADGPEALTRLSGPDLPVI